jgi:molecular chaperone HtpG
MSKHQFQTEVSQLLHLMIHSLYSHKEIFLRELVSNASDAIDKLNYLTLTDENYKDVAFTPQVEIKVNKELKTLSISDNGIGMNEEEMIEHLGTIAKSGTKSFLNSLTGDAKKDSQLIGQFGVGFYSAFMVANQIEVVSRKAKEEDAYKWSSDASGEFEINKTTKESFGTEITLFLKDDATEYMESWAIESIIKKYSNHIPFAIYLEKEVEIEDESGDEDKKDDKKEPKKELKMVQINKASALWRLPKSQIKQEEYDDFYSQISGDSEKPIMHTHTKAEGTLEYTTLFYVPKTAPFDLFRADYKSGVKLYVKRVFITDDDKELLPTYLRFVRGIIDAEDLPLNVSREILQQNQILSAIKKASVKKLLGEFKKLKEKDSEKYLEFFKTFGKVLKEGLYNEWEHKEALLDLMLFKSSKRDGLVSLEEYKNDMKETQSEIYYITGENEALLRNSPIVEKFRSQDIEVLLLDDEVDTIVIPMVNEYKGTPLKAANTAQVNESEETKKKKEEATTELKNIIEKMKEILKVEAKDVKVSATLTDSPACLVFDKDDPDFQMQQMFKQMGQMENMPKVKPILEINASSEIFKKLNGSSDDGLIEDVSKVLFTEAMITEGLKVEDPSDFAKRLNRIIAKSL